MAIPESEWTKGQREFVGTTFKVDGTGAILTVIGVKGKNRSGIAKFSVECSICTKDVELFTDPVFSIYKSHLQNKDGSLKVIPCGCSKKPQWTEQQDEILTQRLLDAKMSHLKVVGSEKVKGKNRKFILECKVCSNDSELWPLGSIASVKGSLENSQTPCGCSNCPNFTDRQDEILIQRILDEKMPHLKVVSSDEVKGKPRRFTLECNVCSRDDELWPLGSITSIKGGLVHSNSTPCGCAFNPKWSEEQWKIKVSREATQRGYIFHGWGGKFKGRDTKLDLYNPKTNNRWQSTIISSFFHQGSGDPVEATSGYNTALEGRLYLVEWFGFGKSYLKKGITNRQSIDRIKQQYSKSKLDCRILREIHSEDGQLIADLEKFLNKRFDGSQCPKDWLPDGYTETVENTPEVYQELSVWFDRFEDVVSGELKLKDVIKEEA